MKKLTQSTKKKDVEFWNLKGKKKILSNETKVQKNKT